MTTSWKWYQFKKNEIDQIKQMIEEDSYSLNKEWLNQVKENRKNILRIEIHSDNKRIVKGSLIYNLPFLFNSRSVHYRRS